MLTFEGQQSSGGAAIIEKLVVSCIISMVTIGVSLLIHVTRACFLFRVYTGSSLPKGRSPYQHYRCSTC